MTLEAKLILKIRGLKLFSYIEPGFITSYIVISPIPNLSFRKLYDFAGG